MNKRRCPGQVFCLPRFLLVVLLHAAPVTVWAGNLISTETLKQKWGATLAGAITTVAVHELGHFAAAEIEGSQAYFDGITIRYRHEQELSTKQKLRLSSAGYHSQWLASEYAFWRLSQNQSSYQSSAFHAGMVLGHIGVTVAYATILNDHQDGDLIATAQYSKLSRDEALLALLIPAALDTWRLFGNAPRWVPWVSRGAKGIGIAWSWTD